jgi:hypothetical protein
MKIIRKRKTVQYTLYRRVFDYHDRPGSGFSFPCDAHGELDLYEMPEEACKNFQRCLNGELDVIDRGVVWLNADYTQSAAGQCDCGVVVELTGFTNTCECGADYNMSGQRLTNRCFWGEETGESVEDILAIDRTPTDDLFDHGGE